MLRKLSVLAVLVSLGLFTIGGCSPTPKGEPEVKKRDEKMETPKEDGGGAAAAIE